MYRTDWLAGWLKAAARIDLRGAPRISGVRSGADHARDQHVAGAPHHPRRRHDLSDPPALTVFPRIMTARAMEGYFGTI